MASIPVIVAFILLLFLFILTLAFMIYHRVFQLVIIRNEVFQAFGFLYQHNEGDYRQNITVLQELAKKVAKTGIKVVNPVSIYYDNPRKVKRSDLRSDVGFMIPENEDLIHVDGLQYKTVCFDRFLATSVPYKSRFSILIGAMKIYPVFRKELEKQDLPEREMIEIYDMRNKLIVYLMPIKAASVSN